MRCGSATRSFKGLFACSNPPSLEVGARLAPSLPAEGRLDLALPRQRRRTRIKDAPIPVVADVDDAPLQLHFEHALQMLHANPRFMEIRGFA